MQREERHAHDSRRETGRVGLKNQGATCYMNSLLQARERALLWALRVGGRACGWGGGKGERASFFGGEQAGDPPSLHAPSPPPPSIHTTIQYLYHLPYFRKAVYHMPVPEDEEAARSLPLALQSLFFRLQVRRSACVAPPPSRPPLRPCACAPPRWQLAPPGEPLPRAAPPPPPFSSAASNFLSCLSPLPLLLHLSTHPTTKPHTQPHTTTQPHNPPPPPLPQYAPASVSTTALTRTFGWSSHDAFQQHDVQEMNRVLCEKLEEKMKACGGWGLGGFGGEVWGFV